MRRSRSGFSLFEIIIVLFIFSLVAALAVPSFSRLGDNVVRTDARRLASVIRSLSESAVARKETYSLKVDFAKRAVSYTSPGGERNEQAGSLVSVDLQSKGTISEGEVTIFFHAAGGGEAFSMHLRNDDASFVVSYNPLSGRVRVSGEKS